MRYLVRARVRPGKEEDLLRAIDAGTLGTGSVAGDEYLSNMQSARLCDDGTARWVEVCFCAEPLEEERPYWEEVFRAGAGPGRAQPQALPRRIRRGALGVRGVQLYGQPRAADGDVGAPVPGSASRSGR